MPIFLYVAPIFIFLLYLSFRIADVKNLCVSILSSQKEISKNLDERITSMRDLVRSVDKAIYKLQDELSHHGGSHSTDQQLKPQISAIEAEIKDISKRMLKLTTLLVESNIISQSKTKKVKND